MPRARASSVAFPKLLSPVGGMLASIVAGGVLWSGLLVGIHAAGAF